MGSGAGVGGGFGWEELAGDFGRGELRAPWAPVSSTLWGVLLQTVPILLRILFLDILGRFNKIHET
jgi:hypothetical protein